MVAMDCRHDLWLKGRPLQASCLAPVQPPSPRPNEGISPAVTGLATPSGAVPGGGEDGRRSTPVDGSGAKGPFAFLLS